MEKILKASGAIFRYLIIPILIGLSVAVILRHTVFFVAYIPSSSMKPTLNSGDRVLTNRLAYKFDEVERFDVVVFKQEGSDTVMVKRVIGMPNEKIYCKDNVIYIDDEPLEQDFLDDSVVTDDFGEFEIPDDCYFMMGDNRKVSLDSRYWENPYVKSSEIWGKPIYRIKSFDDVE